MRHTILTLIFSILPVFVTTSFAANVADDRVGNGGNFVVGEFVKRAMTIAVYLEKAPEAAEALGINKKDLKQIQSVIGNLPVSVGNNLKSDTVVVSDKSGQKAILINEGEWVTRFHDPYGFYDKILLTYMEASDIKADALKISQQLNFLLSDPRLGSPCDSNLAKGNDFLWASCAKDLISLKDRTFYKETPPGIIAVQVFESFDQVQDVLKNFKKDYNGVRPTNETEAHLIKAECEMTIRARERNCVYKYLVVRNYALSQNKVDIVKSNIAAKVIVPDKGKVQIKLLNLNTDL
ncbi:MAG: hypothetical protein AB7T49_10725 [Oligoflexales bacterium]